MKLLRVISSIDPTGGGPIEGARKIDTEMRKLGHQVEVVSQDRPGQTFLSDYPATVHAMGPSSFVYGYNKRLLPWLREHLQAYDAVIVNGIWQYHSLATWRALRRSAVPYFVFTHGMMDPWFKQKYPLKHLKKWLYWPWAEYRVLRDARAVIFTSEEERLLARQSFWLYRCNETVISYGTASPPENDHLLAKEFIAAHPTLYNKKILLFLSRIHEKKGCDLLIEAFSKIAQQDPRLMLVMAGPDQTGWMKKLKALASKLGIAERICWPGMLQGDMKWGAYYAADVFVLPSHQENFGIVVAEALACGKPVLITNKVNIWREIEQDQVGFVDADSLQGTVRNLQRWLATTPEDYKQMAERAKVCFVERFHINRTAVRLVQIIEENN